MNLPSISYKKYYKNNVHLRIFNLNDKHPKFVSISRSRKYHFETKFIFDSARFNIPLGIFIVVSESNMSTATQQPTKKKLR